MRIAIVAATLTALGVTSSAWGYALNAHVALCQHVLDRVNTKGGMVFNTIGIPDLTPTTATHDRDPRVGAGVRGGKARRGKFTPFALNRHFVRIVSQNPSYFRAGCGAPDAFPFFGNTDPSHSYGWDPATQVQVLWRHARTDQEKAWVIGWNAHLLMDSAVHGFANTYAAMSMKKHLPKTTQSLNRPQVWDTFTVSNFMGHIASESWINNNFVYAARPENTKIDTPMEFAQRMFLSRGSPIRQHYSNILSVWKPGQAGDIKTQIAGPKPGVLGTIFHRSLEHLNQFEDIHSREYYTWEGHVRFYAGKSGFDNQLHHFVAKVLSQWQQGRVKKIRNIYAAWVKSTTELQAAVSRRGSASEFYKAIQPLKEAVVAYASPDLLTADLLPAPLRAMLAAVQAFFKTISEAIGKAVREVVKAVLEPAIEKIKELAEVATGKAIDFFMGKQARDHARGLLLQVGLAKSRTDGEPDAKGVFHKQTTGGIDGGDAKANDANRTRLLQYPFYRNAFMGVLAALADINSSRNLPSADFTNGFRCTDHFVKTRPTLRQFSGVLKGSDPWYNATAEACHTPNHTRVRTFNFLNYDYDKMYSSRLTSSRGYDFKTVVMTTLRNLGGALAQAGDWAWQSIFKPIVDGTIKAATTAITDAWDQAKKKVTAVVTNVTNTVTAGVKKVTDFVGYNLCNGGCNANWVPWLTCFRGRAACDTGRRQCFTSCDNKFKK